MGIIRPLPLPLSLWKRLVAKGNRVRVVGALIAALFLSVVSWALKPGDFVTDGPRSEKKVALSFDDGPGPFTPQVLEVLKKYEVHGTFFMNGDQVKMRPQFAKAVKEAGHEIGDHTYSHLNFYTYKATNPIDKLKAQMELSRKVIEETTGVTPVLCRMPYGCMRPWIREVARREGYVLVNWTFGCDWQKMTPEAKRAAYLKAIRPGAIFLMHDGGRNREGTVFALDGLIAELKKRGYEMVTVGELIKGNDIRDGLLPRRRAS